MHLLIVDDDGGTADVIAAAALKTGWTADVSRTEDEFRARFDTHCPDAVLLDLQLGSSDGIQQLKFLARRKYPGAIALMSGFDSRVLETARQIGTSLGLRVTATLEKPARLAALREVLDSLVRPQEARPPRSASQPAAGPTDDPITPQQIRDAMVRRELQLHLQPIVTARRYAVSRLEALVRWVHPKLGVVPPLRFIPVAEQDQSLMNSLTSWVIETALDHYEALSRDGYSLPIAVNISALDLQAIEFPDRVAALISARGLPVDALILEVTESVVMQDTVRTSEILSRLRLKGIGIAIDDLGTGYSSLTSLRRMPFSEMKIDATFVRDVVASRESRAIVKSLVDLSHSMAIGSVAEGVETQEVAQELIDMGVDYLQGYHFSRPLSMDQLKTWLPTRLIAIAASGAHTPASSGVQRPAALPETPLDPAAPTEAQRCDPWVP